MNDLSDGQGSGADLGEAIEAAFEAMVQALVAFLMFLLLMLLQALRVFFTLAPGLARLAAVGLVITAVVLTWPKVFAAYGSAPVSILPALCVTLAPVAFALAVGERSSFWGALVLAAASTGGIGVVLPRLPVVARGLAVVGALVGVVFHFLSQSQEVTQDEPKIG